MNIEYILRDLEIIICRYCGALSHLPTVKIYKSYGRNTKLCPACKGELLVKGADK